MPFRGNRCYKEAHKLKVTSVRSLALAVYLAGGVSVPATAAAVAPTHFKQLLPSELQQGLTLAERKLLQCVEQGKEADFSSADASENDPQQWSRWGPERMIRGRLLCWLCTDRTVARYVSPKGICVRGAKIAGSIECEGAEVLYPLALRHFALPEGIILTRARAKTMDFSGSYVRGLWANWTVLEGDLVLSGATYLGELQLRSATIRGDLNCSGARFENPSGYILLAPGASITGNVDLRWLRGWGCESLMGANIQGNLLCM
ncbi:hypothetical protein A7Q09_05510 [Methylacidiphilum sp. Yel]|nr:hypothetical protein A7Q09_05510 [Methylacidiphilum sp. Yel]